MPLQPGVTLEHFRVVGKLGEGGIKETLAWLDRYLRPVP